MVVAIIVLAIAGLVCLPQGGENVWYGLAALAAALILLIIKIVKRSRAEQYIREREQEYQETLKNAEIARRQFDEQERIRLEKSNAWHSVHDKWQVIIDKHTRLLNDIGVAYTVANNLNLPDSPQMQHVINLCLQDISLAEMYSQALAEIHSIKVSNGWASASDTPYVTTSFPTFKRLAIIYEKQKKYDEAIAVCQRAIELGFSDDGTDGQMPGRIARLMKKKGKNAAKIEPAEEIIINNTEL